MSSSGVHVHQPVRGDKFPDCKKLEFDLPCEPVSVKVVGIGDAGCRVVSTFSDSQPLSGCIYMDTDTQSLHHTSGRGTKLRLGEKLCRGLSPGPNPDIGRMAAAESHDDITKAIHAADCVFLVAGLGGSTGGGALPYVAELANESSFCIAVVTLPFRFEGRQRMQRAEDALHQLCGRCDAVIVLPLREGKLRPQSQTNIKDVFEAADAMIRDVLCCLWETICLPGVIGPDIAELKEAFDLDGQPVYCGSGKAAGPDRLQKALALANTESAEGTVCLLHIRSGGDLEVSLLDDLLASFAKQGEDIKTFACAINDSCEGNAVITVFRLLQNSRKGW